MKKQNWKRRNVHSIQSANDACFYSIEEVGLDNEDNEEKEEEDFNPQDFIHIDDFKELDSIPDKQLKSAPEYIHGEWSYYNLNPLVIQGLHELGFDHPTNIQQATLPYTMTYRDVVGAAQTVISS